MNAKLVNEAAPAIAPRRASITDKAIVLSLSVIGTAALTYIAWYRLPTLLWHWATEALWHWVPVAFALLFLTLPPVLAAGGTVSVFKLRSRTRRLFWYTALGFLAALALGLLILWSFVPSGTWWKSGYWWIWAVLVVALSVVSIGARMFTVVQPVTKRKRYKREWRFNHNHPDVESPPALGVAMSGGGIRSAAFNLGVLQALHESGILRSVDVMSAVSGGTYAMSWYMLQPFYAAKASSREKGEFRVDDIIDEMFDPNGRFQSYLLTNPKVVDVVEIGINAVFGATLGQPLRALTAFGDDLDQYNSFGPRRNYRESLQKLFQGHPTQDSRDLENRIDFSWKQDTAITDFSAVTPVTYRELADFAKANHLPFFIFNCAVLVDRPFRRMLWPTAFELTADDLGGDVCGYRRWADLEAADAEEVGERTERKPRLVRWLDSPEEHVHGRWVKMVNVAPAISGAAIGLAYFNPKKSQRCLKLATWMPFVGNIDLGYLLPRKILRSESPLYVSDGGHGENLGAYALIRRDCRKIIVVDAEREPALPYAFQAYCKLRDQLDEEESRLLRVEEIEAYLRETPSGPPPSVMTGTVAPKSGADCAEGCLSIVYIKLGLDRNQLDSFPPEVRAYAETSHLFPQDPTSDQSFSPEQFTAYRILGRHIGLVAAKKVSPDN